jgi:hypothetical protein
MNMGIENRIQMLVQHIKKSRKTVLNTALIASAVAIFVFLAGSYFFLFDYYEELHRNYYRSITGDISSFQDKLISQGSYRDDMRKIAGVLMLRKGVLNVWFTDRFGKLIYHTDQTVLGDYKARRLPADYYESIEHMWEFENGSPTMHIVSMTDWSKLRVSLPLYISGREDHDFIIGMDVKRFFVIPGSLRIVVLFSVAFIILAVIIVYFPLFFWVRERFGDMETQALVLTTPMKSQPSPVAGEVSPQQQEDVEITPEQRTEAPVEVPEPVSAQPAPAQPSAEKRVAEPQKTEKKAAPAVTKVVEKEKPAAQKRVKAEKFMSKEIEEDRKLIQFLKEKRTLFAKSTMELGFVQAHSYVFNSKGAEGSYFLYKKGNNNHLYACFDLPSTKPLEAFTLIPEIGHTLESGLKDGVEIADLFGLYNDYFNKGNTTIDLALVLIDEVKGSVAYSTCGKGYALYLKTGEDTVKELRFDNPPLGGSSWDMSKGNFSSADIKFTQNDIFAMLPQSAASIEIGKDTLDRQIKVDLVQYRNLSAQTIGMEIVNRYDSLDLNVKNTIPQTGFVMLKFL